MPAWLTSTCRALCAAVLSAALLLCVPRQGAAQSASPTDGTGGPPSEQTRTEKLMAARRAKLAHLDEPEDSALEEVVAWVEEKRDAFRYGGDGPNLLNVSPVLGGLRSGAGEAAGLRLGLAREEPDQELSLAARASTKRYWGLKAQAGFRPEPLVGYAYAQYRHMPQETFYGVGYDAGNVETDFLHDEFVGGALAGLRLTPRVLVGGQAAYLVNDLGPGADDARSDVEARFSPAEAPGLGRDLDYGIFGAFVELDYRRHELERDYGERFTPTKRRLRGLSLDARRGFYVAAEVNHYADRAGGDFSFTRFDVDMHQYVPIRRGFQVLALRQLLTLSHVGPGARVPFYLMETVGGKYTIRGFDEHRFRDLNALVLNAEYRYQIWVLLDLALFVDAGQVFHDVDELALGRLETGYGLGFRFKTPQALFARIDLAHSREGFALELSLGSVL